jgi:LCP family protein required for cell wall assembly
MEEGFSEKVRSVHGIEIKIYDVFDATDVDVLKEPFNIYISGLDTTGDISEVSRSDVNMIVTVNPNTHKILLTSIPRDYYVQLHGTTGTKDKLTHSGIYGPKMTVKTVEDLMGITINYFVRVNYSSVIKLVDAIGGVYLTPDITLHRNHYEITCYYYAGVRTLYDGPCALRYARERKAYRDGDVHRVQNQQQVLMAIFDKLSSAEILRNYSNILSAIEGSIETSIPENKFYQIINYQLDNMPKWNIENIHLDGVDGYAGIYSSNMDGTGDNGSFYYVMEPNPESVENAKAKIDAIFAGE